MIVIKAFRFAVDLHLADTVVFVGSGLYRQGAALLHEDCFPPRRPALRSVSTVPCWLS